MATQQDLKETVRLVESAGRRIVSGIGDVRDIEALRTIIDDGVKQLGRLDIVSANAGICSLGRVLDLTGDQWRDMIDVNLTGVFNTVQASVPHIVAGGRGGSIILTSSGAGLVGYENIGHYVAAKHGVIGLMKTLALELGPQYIRVNAICPGQVHTDMMNSEPMIKLFMPDAVNPSLEERTAPDSPYRAVNAIPIPWLEPIDISNTLLFLASDESRYITGVPLPVDGGFLVR
ncbi:NAD(P)-dependent dehydrogenase (short-subunit alcohol dehydrogenase family) [Arthrobacter sp. SLBN-100]|nr:NAD(P)-dependent dehydrogenase (short-subunit alcohol dehydrogenase family) [Arthrobacter sp. SLBN-100]